MTLFLNTAATEIIYVKGQPANEIYYLVSGSVRVINDEGDTILNISEGSIFGEVEAIE
jgi:CRP-like cAMP-binding protein